jgi:uncharacterized protein (TIGR03437 family)
LLAATLRHSKISTLLLLAALGSGQVNVTTYRNDLSRSGLNSREVILKPANVNAATFGKLFSRAVDGEIYAQPLYLSLVNISGKGIHNVVLVATEHNSLYAFDADSQSGANADPLWHTNLTGADAGERTIGVSDVWGCGSIAPELGITGTPVIDPLTGTLYVVASTIRYGTFIHRLHALDVSTGAERPGSPVAIDASVPGTGDGFSQLTVPFRPYLYKNRAGLLLLNGVVYTAWTSFCDSGAYHGWLIGYDATDLHQISIYNNSPNAFAGSLWMGGAAPAADGDGNIYVVSGNGQFDGDTNGSDLGDSFIKLSSTAGLAVADYFTPFNQDSLNRGDIDLGSSGPLLLPDEAGSGAHRHLLIGAGKEGRIYLLDRDQLGHFHAGADSQIVQSIVGATGAVFGGAAYFDQTLYYAPAQDTVKAFGLVNGYLTTAPASQSPQRFGGLGAAPTVSADGETNGIVWAVEASSGGTLHAYNASNVAQELYNSQTNRDRDALGPFVKFSVPLVANGKVYVGTGNSLAVFGLLNQPPQPVLSSVVNGASLKSGPVAPGSLISIFGSGLAPATTNAAALPLPRNLGTVTLSIDGIPCPLLFVSPTQMNAQVPFEVPLGPAMAVLQLPDMPPAAIAIDVNPAAPGIFTNGMDQQPGLSNVQLTSLGQSGWHLLVYLTGQGPVAPSVASGSPAPVNPTAQTVYPVHATFGGRAAEVVSVGLWPGAVGILQLELRAPAMRAGSYQLVVTVNGVASNPASISVPDSPATTANPWK